MRNLISNSERWIFDTDPGTCLGTMIVYEEDGKIFATLVPERYSPANPLDLDAIVGEEVRMDLIWPAYDESLSIAPENTEELFVKQPRYYEFTFSKPEAMKARVLGEAWACEQIKRRPHPSLAEFVGCKVVDGKIQGLVFRRYKERLCDRVKRPFDFDKIMRSLAYGLAHLHCLGLIHGDISPSNIMLDENDRAVLIDFDSCLPVGTTYTDDHKFGTKFFAPPIRPERANVEADKYSMNRICDYLFVEYQNLKGKTVPLMLAESFIDETDD